VPDPAESTGWPTEPTRSTPRCPGPYGLAGGWNGRATEGTGESGHPNRATGASEEKARGAVSEVGTGAAGDTAEGAGAEGGTADGAENADRTAGGAQATGTGVVSGASGVSRTAITAVTIRAGMRAG